MTVTTENKALSGSQKRSAFFGTLSFVIVALTTFYELLPFLGDILDGWTIKL